MPKTHAFAPGLILIGMLSALSPVQAGDLRSITHEDVWLMKRAGSPEVSPDGRWIAFTLEQPAYDDDAKSSDIWLVPADGSAPARQLTQTKGTEGDLAWSPDSTGLAFTARREGDTARQAYVLDLAAGGEARRVTDLAGGAQDPVWRPDGRALLVTTMVYPGVADEASNVKAVGERKERKYSARAYDDFPIRRWDRWLDERRPMLVVQPLDDAAEPRYVLAGSKLFLSRGFGGTLGNSGESIQAAWTPDSTGIVFVATDNRHESARVESLDALWLVPATGGEPRRLTGPEGDYSQPSFGGPGGALHARFSASTEFVYNLPGIVRFSWPDLSDRRLLTSGLDRPVSDYEVGADGTVRVLADDGANTRLYAIPPDGSRAAEVGRLARGVFSGLSVSASAEPVLAAKWESAVQPEEIGRIDASSGEWTALTDFNTARAAHIDWQPLRDFWFESKAGRRIHSLVALPPGFDPAKRYPLFVLIHGGPHSAFKDQFIFRWNYHLLAAPGYVVVMPNYTGSTGYGEDFSRGIQRDPLAGPAREINEAADEAIRRFAFIDGTRQAAGGASYGGHLSNWLAVTTTRYKAIVSHAGLYDLKTQWTTSDVVYSRERNMGGPAWADTAFWMRNSPFYRSPKLRTPTLITFGEQDFRVPINNGIEFWTALKRQDVPSRLVVFPDENHWILKGENSRYFYSEVRDWLAKYL